MHRARRAARGVGGALHHLLQRVEGIARRLGGAGAGAGDGDGAVAEIVGEAQRLPPAELGDGVARGVIGKAAGDDACNAGLRHCRNVTVR